MPDVTQRLILGIISAISAAVFFFFFALTFHTPEWVEQFAGDFIEQEVARQIDDKIESVEAPSGDSALKRAAAALYRINEREIERYRESLRQQIHVQIADAIAAIRDLDCECRAKWAEWLERGTTGQLQLLGGANQRITEFIQATYAEVTTNLKRDIRIFTAANAVVFMLVFLVSLIKPKVRLQLMVPASLAAIATITCSYFYVFEQNWLLTIIYNDYLGFAYLAYLGLVFAFLCDILLNRARITTAAVNAVLSAAGSAVSALPC